MGTYLSSFFWQNDQSSRDPCETCANDIFDESSLSIEIFQQFYSKLVDALPMDDPNFTVKLYSAHLLSSYLKEYVESRSSATRTEKATRFLDQVIKPSVTSFDKLLHVMEDSEYQHVKELAEEIKIDALKNKSIKAFGVAPVENKVASTTPTFPIVESNTTAEDESVKLPTVPVTLDAKIAPPIADDDSLGGGSEIEKVVEINKSSSNLTKPLSLMAGLKDSEVTEVTSDSVENAELTMKENKLTDPTVQFGEVYFVLG